MELQIGRTSLRVGINIMYLPGDVDVTTMKKHLCKVFHGKEINSIAATARKKLVLHFDLNKTIVPVDSATGETVEAALNVYLSGLAQGKDRQGEWHSKHELSTAPVEQDDVSYYKFEEKRLLPQITRDRSAFRYHLMSFTDKPQGSKFKPHLKELLNSLTWTLPYEEKAHKDLTVPGSTSYRYHFILPAFYKLLESLVTENRNFCVVFRTYGSDAKSVLSSIRQAVSGDFPFGRKLLPLLDDIDETVYFVSRQNDIEDVFTIDRCSSDCSDINDMTSKTDEEIYSWISNMVGIHAIRDNCNDWLRHDFDSRRGKPFWIDKTDEFHHHVFFDDNIRPGSVDSIANIRVRDNFVSAFRNIDRKEEHAYLNKNLVPVVFTDAIMDDEYFVKQLRLCEDNFSKDVYTY
ncbi:uncharacterized protein LOC127843962 isoform X2 [Dreissena polymorpha]|uniref:uncharacterized protein LOC127843962 isoform X2 n=1 Tax=Dreissena polymorpha TaxID=45954 RepID=UPI002264010A|nr:uncharacterized protein LOC127843962 isoform X2 [Dreissena polymorpha]